MEECFKKGLNIKITEGFRTKAKQDKLYAQGRTEPGAIVTNAKYPMSGHCWGVCFDFCRNDGKGAYDDSDNFFYKVAQIGKKYGLSWGGDFKGFVDKPHFELKKFMPNYSVNNLIVDYRTPENFIKSWNDIGILENKYKEVEMKIEYDDKIENYMGINKEDTNYIKIRELANQLNLEVDWQEKDKIILLKDKFLKAKYKYGDKEEEILVLNKKGENYIKIRDILMFLDFDVEYEKESKTTIILKK